MEVIMKKLILAGLLAMSSFSIFADKYDDLVTAQRNMPLLTGVQAFLHGQALKTKDFIVASGWTMAKYTGYVLLGTTTLVALGALGHASVQEDKAFGEAFAHGFTMLGGQVVSAIPSILSKVKGVFSSKEAAQTVAN